MLDLPSPIRAYFDANARLDAEAMLAPFAPHAIVRDEARTHQGVHAIRRWIDEASIALPAVAAPRSLRSEGRRHRVTAEVTGAFPGSPIALTFDFRLNDDRIAELEIG